MSFGCAVYFREDDNNSSWNSFGINLIEEMKYSSIFELKNKTNLLINDIEKWKSISLKNIQFVQANHNLETFKDSMNSLFKKTSERVYKR